MPKQALRDDIRALLDGPARTAPLPRVLDDICATLARHPQALRGHNDRYRVRSGTVCTSFALEDGVLRMLAPDDSVDVTLSGEEADLLRVFRREISPAAAMLRGKLKVQGSMAAVLRLAEFL